MVTEQVEHELQVKLEVIFLRWHVIFSIFFVMLGPVRVGDPLTLIIYMRSKYGERKIYKEVVHKYVV